MKIFLRKLLKKKPKRVTQNRPKVRKTLKRKKVNSKSRKILKRENSYSFPSSVYASFVILIGFITLSISIIFLIRQFQPVIKNERLKFLCTYQLGNKKDQRYRDSKLELEKLVGDSDKYCKNFLLPKEKNKKRFRFFPLVRDIFFRFIYKYPKEF